MSNDSAAHGQKPLYHMATDVFLWHQFQGENNNDCAAFSIAIVANAMLNRADYDGYAVARDMEKPVFVAGPIPHVTLHKIPNWATLPWGISGYLQSKGIQTRLGWFGSVENLLRNLRENRLTIVIIGEPLRREGLRFTGWAHAKVLYGFEPTGPQPEKGFYFVDPGYRKEWSRAQHPPGVFWQDEIEFQQQWNNMLRVYVEAGV